MTPPSSVEPGRTVPMRDPQADLELTGVQAERLLAAWLDEPVTCTGIERLRGGMINTVLRLDFARPPHRAVVKLHTPVTGTFADEARALTHLQNHTGCPVPAVHLVDDDARIVPYAALLLEHVEGRCLQDLDLPAADRAEVDRSLAGVLAALHEHTADGWGDIDRTDPAASWGALFTARLAGVRGWRAVSERLTDAALAGVDDVIAAAPRLLADPGVPTLVHGDVWDGNVMVRREHGRWGVVALLDPALEYADVDMELAYLEVFDAQRSAVLSAYTRHRPLRPGYDRRRLVYWLHTALVHVGLFGDQRFVDFTARTVERIGRLEPDVT